jgi:hypothetical protein
VLSSKAGRKTHRNLIVSALHGFVFALMESSISGEGVFVFGGGVVEGVF